MKDNVKIHLFIGPASSGKTRLANEILAAVPHCFPISISGRHKYLFEDSSFFYESATKKTKLILIDDFLLNKKNLVRLKCLALTDPIQVNQKHKWVFEISPIFIVTVEDNSDDAIYQNLNPSICVYKFPLSYLDAANLKEELIAKLTTNE